MAAPQLGYFTARDAANAGYSAQLLNYCRVVGKVTATELRGIYRLVLFPPGEHEDLVVSWLWSDRQGVMSHQTALALHGISAVPPVKVHLTVPVAWRSRRLRIPKSIVLHYRAIEERARGWSGPVPVTKPLRTLEDCIRDDVNSELVTGALRDARARGLITASQLIELRQRRQRARVRS